MRTSFFTLLALGSFFVTALASPVAASGKDKQREIDRAQGYLTTLESTIKNYTGAINATLASSISTAAKISAVEIQLEGLTSAITSTETKITKLTVTKRDIAARQSAASITATLTAILQEVFGTLTAVIADLGLTPLLSFLTPLTTALGNLVLSLEVVVNQLLLVVTELLDGLLTGLGLGLGGLILKS